jgi:hypothetical protein
MFGPDGGLVANAPHIPVHLGAMQETVQYQVLQSLLAVDTSVLRTVSSSESTSFPGSWVS